MGMVYKDEAITIPENFILGTHYLASSRELAILNTHTEGAYLIPMKFDNENQALEYYKNHLKEEISTIVDKEEVVA